MMSPVAGKKLSPRIGASYAVGAIKLLAGAMRGVYGVRVWGGTLVALLTASCLACFVDWRCEPSKRYPKLTPENFAQITLGMTLKEAEEILGVPPGCYHEAPNRVVEYTPLGWAWPLVHPSRHALADDCVEWWSDEWAFRVEIDPDDRFTKTYQPAKLHRLSDSNIGAPLMH